MAVTRTLKHSQTLSRRVGEARIVFREFDHSTHNAIIALIFKYIRNVTCEQFSMYAFDAQVTIDTFLSRMEKCASTLLLE